MTQTLEPGAAFSMRRKEAIEMMNAGVKAVAGTPSNPQMGYQLISSACEADPTMAFGWFSLGNANSDLKLPHGALAAYRRALQLPIGTEIGDLDPPTKAKTLCNMGHTLYHLGRHDEALQATLVAIECDPTLAFAWINLSLIKSITGHDAEAVAAARKSLELDPTNATIETGLGFALLHDRQYAEGLRHMEARFPYKLPQFLSYPYPKWQGEPGKRLFLLSDQGLGDSLDFFRFVPAALKRAGSVVLGIQPELLRLTRDMFGSEKNVQIIPLPQPMPLADHWCALMSLPTALGLTDQEIIDAKLPKITTFFPQAQWKVPGKKLHVAVAWAGNPVNDVDKYRSIDLKQFLELSRVPDTQFYSLQVGERANEIHNVGGAMIFKDVTPFIRDVTDTIGLLRHIDLVITVDTSLGHIAGAIEKECWVPVAYNGCDWRFSRHGDKSLWFQNHRLFRQGADTSWAPVFEDIVRELTARVSSMEAQSAAA